MELYHEKKLKEGGIVAQLFKHSCLYAGLKFIAVLRAESN